jgi:hypothetical protein
MTAAAEEMDEVVVVAYGRAKKASGYLLQPLRESFENRATTNVLSGVRDLFTNSSASGQPGSQPSVRIRG